jgi:hypothetical protein
MLPDRSAQPGTEYGPQWIINPSFAPANQSGTACRLSDSAVGLYE